MFTAKKLLAVVGGHATDVQVSLSSDADKSAVSKLLPPPPEVCHFLAGGRSCDFSAADAPKLHKVGVAAARWFVKAVLYSHVDGEVKAAARALMSKFDFTGSLNFYRVVVSDSKLHAWNAIILPPLKARLNALADQAGAVNIKTRLLEHLGSEALVASGVVRYHPDFPPTTTGRLSLRQDGLMPAVAAAFDFNDWESRQEIIYLHALHLIGQ